MPDALPEAVRTRLGSFGFGQEKAFVPVADLSGGERARLNLALVTHAAPALLILDEPTNHLDIESREVLVQAINDFPGAVVLVSHDEHLIELIADRLWLVAGGTVRPFEGDLEDYRRLVLERSGRRRAAARTGPTLAARRGAWRPSGGASSNRCASKARQAEEDGGAADQRARSARPGPRQAARQRHDRRPRRSSAAPSSSG